MKRTTTAFLWFFLLFASSFAWADLPAFEYFAINTDRLPTSIQFEGDLITLGTEDLRALSSVHGVLESIDKCSVSFASPTFRLDISTNASPQIPNTPRSITYHISAGGRHDWSIVSTHGQAIQVGNSFLSSNWRSKSVIVLFRPINLKH